MMPPENAFPTAPFFDRLTNLEQRFKFLTRNLLFFKKQRCTTIEHIPMLGNHLLCLCIRLINDTLYFRVNCRCDTLTVIVRMCQITANKYFVIVIFITDQSIFSDIP